MSVQPPPLPKKKALSGFYIPVISMGDPSSMSEKTVPTKKGGTIRIVEQLFYAQIEGPNFPLLTRPMNIRRLPTDDFTSPVPEPLPEGKYFLKLPLTTNQYDSLQLDSYADPLLFTEEEYLSHMSPVSLKAA